MYNLQFTIYNVQFCSEYVSLLRMYNEMKIENPDVPIRDIACKVMFSVNQHYLHGYIHPLSVQRGNEVMVLFFVLFCFLTFKVPKMSVKIKNFKIVYSKHRFVLLYKRYAIFRPQEKIHM